MAQQQNIETEDWSFGDWIQANTRAVSIGAVVVLIGGASYWYYTKSVELKRTAAERGLTAAKQSLAAGNPALAATDLQRVSTRYKGTPAGVSAAMLLAEYQFDQDKYAEGLQALAPYQNASAAGESLPQVWALTGDAELAQGKPTEAASAYQKAADATRYAGEKALYQSKAARALTAAGKTAEAKAIWERLATDPEAALVKNEALIRLGELAVQPAGKS
jgi:predicted negative regulator of RcsB-dependent stress response